MILLADIAILVVGTTLLALLAKKFRQPMILAYIITGIVVGPSVLGLVSNLSVIQTLSQLGIAFLLFIVGLELDVRKLRDVGRVAVVGAFVQFFGISIIAALAGVALGFGGISSIYIGLALGFSSTILVVKLLGEKNELDTLHGRMALGILLVQDLLAVVALILLANLDQAITGIMWAVVKAAFLLALAGLSGKLLERSFRFIAESQEILFLFSVSWCFVFAGIAWALGFSIAIGSFLAGISLATFPYNIEIIGRVKSLKDFFSTIFFVSLGMLLVPATIATLALPILVLALIVLVGTPVVIFFVLGTFGYEKKTAFFVGTALAQVSEFSLILVAQGGDQATTTIVTAVAVLTMVATSYLIQDGERIYRRFAAYLTFFPGRIRETPPQKFKDHTIIFGCHRMGRRILEAVKSDKIVVDFNPEIVGELKAEGIPVVYGDMEDVEVLEAVNVKGASRIISTNPSKESNLFIIHQAGKAEIVVTAKDLQTARELYQAGANYVILPEFLSGEKIAEVVGEKRIFEKVGEKHRLWVERQLREEAVRKQTPDFFGIFRGIGRLKVN